MRYQPFQEVATSKAPSIWSLKKPRSCRHFLHKSTPWALKLAQMGWCPSQTQGDFPFAIDPKAAGKSAEVFRG